MRKDKAEQPRVEKEAGAGSQRRRCEQCAAVESCIGCQVDQVDRVVEEQEHDFVNVVLHMTTQT